MKVIPAIAFLLLSFPLCLNAFECEDLAAARDYCDAGNLAPIEGIWQLPEDKVSVLISRSDREGLYEIRVVESLNGALEPGKVIGEALRTPDVNLYKITFYGKEGKLFSFKQTFAGTLKGHGETLALKKKKFNLRFNVLSLIPHLGRLLYISPSDPAADIPAGLYKLYPSYDGNGSSRLKPRDL